MDPPGKPNSLLRKLRSARYAAGSYAGSDFTHSSASDFAIIVRVPLLRAGRTPELSNS